MIVVSRFMIPPGTCCIQPPTTKIGTTTLFTQKLDHPLIKNPVLVDIRFGHRIRIGFILEIAFTHFIEKIGCFFFIAASIFTFSKHIIDFSKTNNRIIRIKSNGFVDIVGNR